MNIFDLAMAKKMLGGSGTGGGGGNAGGGGGTQLYKHSFSANVAGIFDANLVVISPSNVAFDIFSEQPLPISVLIEVSESGQSMYMQCTSYSIATINDVQKVVVSLVMYMDGTTPLEFVPAGYALTITGNDVVTPL